MVPSYDCRSPDKFSSRAAASEVLAHVQHALELPLLIAHGRDGDDYCVDQTCDDLRLLHAGGFNVTLRQYPCGQELTTHMLAERQHETAFYLNNFRPQAESTGGLPNS